MKKIILVNLPFFLLMVMLVDWILSYSHIDYFFQILINVVIGLLCFVFFTSFFVLKEQLSILLMTISIMILSVEAIVFVGINTEYLSKERFSPVRFFAFDQLPVFQQNAVEYDSIIGYRWSPSPVQVYKLAMEEKVFENTFKGNNYGFHSNRDYQQKKSNSTTKRWIVFGDSFTDAYFLQRGWVDVLDSLYKKSGNAVELYSFSVNGGGIKNWYQIFTRLIIGEFEYDGVIFAIFGNDLDRDFFVMHQEGSKTLSKYYSEVPDRNLVISDTRNLDENDSRTNIYSEIYSRTYGSKFINYVYRKFLEGRYFKTFRNSNEHLRKKYIYSYESQLDESALRRKYEENYDLIDKMLDTLGQMGKPLILMTIPDEYGLILNQQSTTTSLQQELKWLSDKYGAEYIDGYRLMLKYSDNNDKNAFIPYDGHWGQTASDNFAKGFFEEYRNMLMN